MRLATAYDEIMPLKDPRVQANPGYLVIILLSRVITRLGGLEIINPKMIEGMFSADVAYLQDMYRRINANGDNRLAVTCPHCEQTFAVEIDDRGGHRLPLEPPVRGGSLHRLPFPLALRPDHGAGASRAARWVAEIAKINRRLTEG